jgi:hypothetical protein
MSNCLLLLLLLVSRLSSDKQDELIELAKTPSGAYIEESMRELKRQSLTKHGI